MQKRTDFFDNSLLSIVPDIPLVIRNKPHNNQLCADLSRFISAYPVVSHFLRFAWQTTTSYSTTSFDDPISSIYVDDIGNIIIIDYNTSNDSDDQPVDIGYDGRKKKAEEYLSQFFDPKKYKFDGSEGNNFIFSYFSGDIPTYDSICISMLDDGSLNIIRHFYNDRFDENSYKAFDNVSAIDKYAQEVLLNELEGTGIKVNYFEKPVISGYKGETVLLIICELQKNNKFSEDAYSLVQGGIIVKPK